MANFDHPPVCPGREQFGLWPPSSWSSQCTIPQIPTRQYHHVFLYLFAIAVDPFIQLVNPVSHSPLQVLVFQNPQVLQGSSALRHCGYHTEMLLSSLNK